MAGGLDKFECDRGFLTLKKHNLNQTKQTAIVYKSQTVKLANKMKSHLVYFLERHFSGCWVVNKL